jgi:hypothetical protein
VRVKSLQDRVGHVMRAEYVASFTTADTIPPVTLSTSPAAATVGASIFSPVRLTFNEAIDPARFRAAPFALLAASGPVAGRLDFLFGNTVVVFTPNLPLTSGVSYRWQSPPAVDLSANVQAAGLDYVFTTTDGRRRRFTARRRRQRHRHREHRHQRGGDRSARSRVRSSTSS